MAKTDQSSLGEIIKSHRIINKLGSVEFSNRAGLSERTLRNIETGKTTPTLEATLRIAAAMGVPSSVLTSSLRQPTVTARATIANETSIVITDNHQLRAWLSRKPISWNRVISNRISLRSLPNIGSVKFTDEKHDGIEKFLLSAFRALHISIYTIKYGSRNTKINFDIVTTIGGLEGKGKLPQVVADVGGAIFHAATALDRTAAAKTMDRAIRSFGDRGEAKVRDLWSAVSSDCTRLAEETSIPRNLVFTKLWPDGQPLWFIDQWRSFQKLLRTLGPQWTIWARLYESWLNGNMSLGLSADFSVRLDRFLYGQSSGWWSRSATEISADIEKFVKDINPNYDEYLVPLNASQSDAIILTQRPAPHHFGERDGLIFAYPTLSHIGTTRFGQDIWEETFEKARRAAERLGRTQAPAHVIESVGRLLSSLGEGLEDIAPGILLMRSRTIEAILATFDSDQARNELMADTQSLLHDLAASLEDLRALFPEIIEIEAARIAQKVAEGSALPAYDNAKQVMTEARTSLVVDKSAINALETALVDIAEVELVIDSSTNETVTATAIKKRANLISLHLLDVRNFSASVLKNFKHVGGEVKSGSKRILTRGVSDVSKRVYKGALDGVEEGAKAGVKIALAALVTNLAGPLAGLAVYVGSFVSLSRKASELVDKIEDEERRLDV